MEQRLSHQASITHLITSAQGKELRLGAERGFTGQRPSDETIELRLTKVRCGQSHIELLSSAHCVGEPPLC